MAIVQARSGVDIVAPSDMMDGRVMAIRDALDQENFIDTMIMSYTAKYASSIFMARFEMRWTQHPSMVIKSHIK